MDTVILCASWFICGAVLTYIALDIKAREEE